VLISAIWEYLVGSILAKACVLPLHPLLLQLEFSWSPGLVEPWIERAVEAQDCEPSSAGNSLNPVAFFTGWRLRTEVEVVGAVGVFLDPRTVASFGGKLLVRLKHGSRLRVVNDHRPKVFGRRVRRQRQFIVLPAVEVVALRICTMSFDFAWSRHSYFEWK
jgi:hypothetical protein